ncbi:MAG: hypothetical protein PW845_29495 [Pseudomonas sp.]|uniref:hypothetical protein n=1 Tax=Pseudomonas abieticivorans TaxID=2931382 RepID=UPI0020BE777F|nr:hypothetical protein [Pseudomonas sp. PIA16]MDE1169401.1 hypothetical protein [Pseudomonas sp.]
MADRNAAPLAQDILDPSHAYKPTDFPRIGRVGAEKEEFELSSLSPWVSLADEEEEEE